MLIDRDQEFSALDTWWSRVRQRSESATITIEGPAGIGKSSLLRTWLATQRDHGTFVLETQADEYASSPLSPIRWGLEAAAAHDPAIGASARERCLAALRAAPTGLPPEEPVGTLLAEYLRAASEDSAVIVCIEDIHVADDDTLQLCTELARMTEVPVLLILTLRPNQGRNSIGFEAFLQRQIDVGRAHRLSLRPLRNGDIERLVQRQLGQRPTDGQLAAITRISRGNPLFVRLGARLLTDDPAADLPKRWPTAARDELLRRFVPVDGPESHLGARLAEFGRFSWPDLPRLSLLTGRSEPEVREQLSFLVRQGVLSHTAVGLEFAHPLIREAFANLLGPDERSQIHLLLAQSLFEAGGSESLFEAATHLSAAGSIPANDQLQALVNAAGAAMWVAPSPAASWFKQVRTAPTASAELRAQATTGEITALIYSGRSIDAWDLCQQAMAAIPADYRPAELIEATGAMAFATANFPALIGLLDEDTPSASTTITRSFAATGQIMTGDTAAGVPNYRRALDDLLADPPGTSPMVYVLTFGCAALLGDVTNLVTLRDLALIRAEQATPVERELLLTCIDLQALHLPSDLGRMPVATARRPNRVSAAGSREVTQAFQYFQHGEWDTLLDYVPAQLELLRATGNVLAMAGPAASAAAALIEREQWDAAAEMLRQVDFEPGDTAFGPLGQICLARLEVARGQSDAAISRLRWLEQRARDTGTVSMYSMMIDQLAQLLEARGEHAEAARLAREARTFVGHLDVPLQDAYGLLALARTTTDVRAAHAAYDAAMSMQMPLIQARCELVLAQLGDDTEERLRRAHGMFKELAAVTERGNTERVMRDMGIATPRGHGAHDRLTAVESTIVREVLQGHTNRQIAETLHYSPKTIEMHLSRIYARTGRSGRVDLVKAVTEGDLALSDG